MVWMVIKALKCYVQTYYFAKMFPKGCMKIKEIKPRGGVFVPGDLPLQISQCSKHNFNKKVPLRERKRHTTRHIASTCYAVTVEGTPSVLGPELDGGIPFPGGYPFPRSRQGVHPS